MIVVWILIGSVVAAVSVLLHTLVTRYLDPNHAVPSMRRFWVGLLIRLLLIAVFLWQLVQQELVTLIVTLIVFLAVYAGSLYYIINNKPHWFQPEIKKDNPVWMQ